MDTQRDLDSQRRLALKPGDLTKEEETELSTVTNRLRQLGFLNVNRDPLYELFLRKWAEGEKPEWTKNIELTPEQLKEREALAAEIAAEIAAEKKDTAS